jgi:hypothetical protein
VKFERGMDSVPEISFSGWATTAEDIKQSADAIIAAAQL